MTDSKKREQSPKNSKLVVRVVVLAVYTLAVFWIGRMTGMHPENGETIEHKTSAAVVADTLPAHVELVSERNETIGSDSVRFVFEFRCINPFLKQYRIFFHAYPADKTVLPVDRKQAGFLNFDGNASVDLVSLAKGQVWFHTVTVKSQ